LISVKIPLVPAGAVSFSFHKQCDPMAPAGSAADASAEGGAAAEANKNVTALENFVEVPGFNIGKIGLG